MNQKKTRKIVLFLLMIVVSFIMFMPGCTSRNVRKKIGMIVPIPYPPGGLLPSQTPMFVSFGFDDNGFSGLEGSGGTGGMLDIVKLFASKKNPGAGNPKTFDRMTPHCSYYVTTQYMEMNHEDSSYAAGSNADNPVYVKKIWRFAWEKGNEIGCHSHSHPHGRELSVAGWLSEIDTSRRLLSRPFGRDEKTVLPDISSGIGIPAEDLAGFRTPYLEYNDNAFQAINRKGFVYDCSIEEGFQKNQDGTNFLWPYLLNQGSPGDKTVAKKNNRDEIGDYPGLWEIPVYAVIVPPDEQCHRYGIEPGFRSRLKRRVDYFQEENGKITGFDWNLWVEFRMTKAEFLATMKYTFDLRLQGNRCPLTVGVHSDIYSDKYEKLPNSNPSERLAALDEFADYVLNHREARIVSAIELLHWIRNPVPLKGM